MKPAEMKPRRIELIDAVRGLSVCMMLIQHLTYDLYAFCGAPWSVYKNPVCDAIHYGFGAAFILLSGVSSNFSRSNVKRGCRTLGVALVITLVTTAMEMPIIFGVLHLLGVCMVLYGLTQGFWQGLNEKLPRLIPALSAAAAVLTAPLADGRYTAIPHLWAFGFITDGFSSSDYFPLLPWAFVFLFGTWAGKYIREGRMPRWFYAAKAPRLALIGRHSLLIYIAHQPILYALVMLGLLLFGKR